MVAGEALKYVMCECSMAQHRLAKMIGKNQQYVSRFCLRRNDVDELADMLGAMGYEIIIRKSKGGFPEQGCVRIDGKVKEREPQGKLHNNVRALMGGTSVIELAKALGVTRGCVYHYMECMNLTLEVKKRLATALGCDIEDIISYKNIEQKKRKQLKVNLEGLDYDE